MTDVIEIQHADYPHTPGTLYDCALCESECHCNEQFTCVYCAEMGE